MMKTKLLKFQLFLILAIHLLIGLEMAYLTKMRPSTTVAVSQDLNITANFALSQYTFQLSAGIGGSVSEVNTSYDHGSVVPILATPEAGFDFLKWEGNGSIENQFSASTNATITQDLNITAKFQKTTCNISVAIVGKGLVDGTGIYEYGDNCTLSASPSKGYYFDKWSGIGIEESNDSILQINPTQDLNISAQFLPNIHTINVSAGHGGSVTEINSSQPYDSVITLFANPSDGYSFMGWDGNVSYVDQFAVSTNATVIGDANITASFTPTKYLVTINTCRLRNNRWQWDLFLWRHCLQFLLKHRKAIILKNGKETEYLNPMNLLLL
jgi:hypothetical protein